MIKLLMDEVIAIGRKISFILATATLCSVLIACDDSTSSNLVPATNESPQITSASSIPIPENTLSVVTVTASDVNGDTLTYELAGGTDQSVFIIANNTGVLSFITSPDFEIPADSDRNNEYIVEVRVSDGESTDSQIITITVLDVADNANTAPQITSPANAMVLENMTAVITVTATDAERDALSYAINGGIDAARFNINASLGTLRFISPPDFEVPTDGGANNVYQVLVTVNDGLSTQSQLISVAVNNVNDNVPVFTSQASVLVNENSSTVINVMTSDLDGGAATYSLSGGADQARFIIDSSNGTLSFIVAPDFEAPIDNDMNNIYLVRVQANDGLNTQNQLITITVNDVNDSNSLPQITSANSAMVVENSTAVITVTATDIDIDPLNFSLTGGADQAHFDINNLSGVLSFNSAPDYENPGDDGVDNIYLVQVGVGDGTDVQHQLITVSVTNVNDNTPVFTSPASASIDENSTAVITVTAADADVGTLSFSVNGGADQAWFSINASSGALSFNVAPDYETPSDIGSDNGYEVQVNVSDGVNSDNQLIIVTVNDLSEQVSGLPSRPVNATCEITDAPILSSSIQLTQVFNSLNFFLPTVLLQSPVNTDRWYVAEQYSGLIKTFLSAENTTATFANFGPLIDFFGNETGLLGFVFHPDYANNQFVFVYYSAPKTTGGASVSHQSVIARYTATNDSTLDMSSGLEIMRIDQPYTNHNGGNIVFGNDGYLYIGMGDGGSGGDPDDNAQDITSLLGKMLRIDVDNPANGNNYSSPASNPYAGTDASGTTIPGLDELYAIGLRNPWRWSFDKFNGDLLLADVGQSNREEIDVITNGGNYGWRCYEGTASYNTSGCAVQSSYIDPIYEYGRTTGRSITGGFVYRGSAIPVLYGSYIYTDFFSGPIWALSDPTGINPLNDSIITTSYQISTFSEDANGEIYVVDFENGRVFRIDPASGSGADEFPVMLSETGCIDGVNPLQMATGLVPYEINAPFWSDGAEKDRWMALPDGASITIEADDDWSYPVNSVLVKNFDLNGKRVETRLLVHHADGNWGGYSYEWNEAQTDATLLLSGKSIVKEGQTYIYPSSSACFQCHTAITNFVLGPETRQLNRDHTYLSTGINANQLTTLDSIGYLTPPLRDVPANLVNLAEPTDATATLHDRARAYLYTNCSQCHRAGGPTNVNLDFNIGTADTDMNICNVSPTYIIGGSTAIMSPGNSANSSMHLRMTCREGVGSCTPADMMPPLGSVLVDPLAQLVADWIDSISSCP